MKTILEFNNKNLPKEILNLEVEGFIINDKQGKKHLLRPNDRITHILGFYKKDLIAVKIGGLK